MDEQPVTALPPRHRMWLWIWSTVLVTPCAIGILFTLARVTAVPLIITFAPAFLLARLAPADARLLLAYVLMPLQCLIYGGVLARSELTGRTRRTLLALLALHTMLAIGALVITSGRI